MSFTSSLKDRFYISFTVPFRGINGVKITNLFILQIFILASSLKMDLLWIWRPHLFICHTTVDTIFSDVPKVCGGVEGAFPLMAIIAIIARGI